MSDAFSEKADFSGMTGGKDLFIRDVGTGTILFVGRVLDPA
jgi:serine protease inhibitor